MELYPIVRPKIRQSGAVCHSGFPAVFSMPEPQTKRETEGFFFSGPAGTYHRISCSISATVSCMRPSLEERLVASRDSIFRSR